MNKQYSQYANHRVSLKDVLELLTEVQEVVNRQVLRWPSSSAGAAATEETLPQLVGKIQGLELAINRLEHGLGGLTNPPN